MNTASDKETPASGKKSVFWTRLLLNFGLCCILSVLMACAAKQTYAPGTDGAQTPELEEGAGSGTEGGAGDGPGARDGVFAEGADKLKPEAARAMTQALALWRGGTVRTLKAEVCADPNKARALLDRVVKLEPKYAPAYARRGLAASELGLREEAFEDMTAAVRLSPTADNYALRALVSIRIGQIKAARRDLDYALKLKPGHGRAANYLGVLELGQEDEGAACAAFKNGCAAGDCSFLEAARTEKLCR
jgi:hypothetical protein